MAKKINHSLHGPKKISLRRMSDTTWRIFKIMSEFIDGFEFISQFRKEVSVFGSARLSPRSYWYKEAEKLGQLLSNAGYTVITGGGPGIMEATNKGAFETHPERSVGINIQLPMEQRVNKYVTHSTAFHYFFTRKVMLSASSQAYIYFPGGYGTLNEFAEMLELIQTGKTQKTAIILVGKEFWAPMIEWITGTMLTKYKTIEKKDLALFHVVDSAEEVMPFVRRSKERTLF